MGGVSLELIGKILGIRTNEAGLGSRTMSRGRGHNGEKDVGHGQLAAQLKSLCKPLCQCLVGPSACGYQHRTKHSADAGCLVKLATPAVQEVGAQRVDSLGNLGQKPKPGTASISCTEAEASMRIYRKAQIQHSLRCLQERVCKLAGRSNV